MGLRLYNSLTHKKQLFKSIESGRAGIYTCGPTVYNFAHIGNLRAYIVADLLKRALLYNGYSVKHVMNITDVGHLVSDANLGEDKLRVAAQREKKSLHDIAEFYTEDFIKDMNGLNILMPDVMPRASEHTKMMLELIDRLDGKGYLYKIGTGIYFDTSKFKKYGALMDLTFSELNSYLIAGMRVERASGTRNTTDFAVWRFSTPNETEMVWETKYGRGFPGWHIECSAMSMHYLGEHFDIHTGGIDHLPIHHTNEIAQSEAATGKKFVNFWVHNEFLQVDGRKMSKSLGNVYRMADLIEKGYSLNSYRYFILSGYYRSQMNFTFEALSNAQNTLNGIYSFIKRLSSYADSREPNPKFLRNIERMKKEFVSAINNDLNTPLALSKLHEMINATNKLDGNIDKEDAAALLGMFMDLDKVLGLGFERHAGKKDLPGKAKLLIEERERYRKERNFKKADEIRVVLSNEFGIQIEDSESGTKWYWKS